MEKLASWKIGILDDEGSDAEKEAVLEELLCSVHDYLRGGAKNDRMKMLAGLEEDFQKKSEEYFGIEKVLETISESSKRKVLEEGKKNGRGIEEQYEGQLQEMEYHLKEKFFEQLVDTFVEQIIDGMKRLLKDAAYLGHANALFELYLKEEQLRREEKEYERISAEYQKMAQISRKLGRERRMELQSLRQQADISEQELAGLVAGCKRYFNIRKKRDSIEISLSPAGRKYNEYMESSRNKNTALEWEQLMYQNCSRILESIENSYDRGIGYEVILTEFLPDKERALKAKYYSVRNKVVAGNDWYIEGYNILKIRKVKGSAKSLIGYKDKKERVILNNEEISDRFLGEWDKKLDGII